MITNLTEKDLIEFEKKHRNHRLHTNGKTILKR